MLGLHSPAKLAQRRLRAIERGFVRARSAGPGSEWQHAGEARSCWTGQAGGCLHGDAPRPRGDL
eukprot:2373173-Lingulodinium_polyedra.AAC.1